MSETPLLRRVTHPLYGTGVVIGLNFHKSGTTANVRFDTGRTRFVPSTDVQPVPSPKEETNG